MQEQGSECMEPVQAPCGFARQSHQYPSDSRCRVCGDMNGTPYSLLTVAWPVYEPTVGAREL